MVTDPPFRVSHWILRIGSRVAEEICLVYVKCDSAP
eukprot:COSAG01_NODE_73432_length_245_cov_9.924658_1_plen_35_part_10